MPAISCIPVRRFRVPYVLSMERVLSTPARGLGLGELHKHLFSRRSIKVGLQACVNTVNFR